MLTGRVRLSGAATCVVAIVLGMTGCFASTPDPTPSTSAAPSAPPLFASDEEALAAATEAYTAYLAASNAVGQAGWNDTGPLEPLVTADALKDDLAIAEDYRAQGYVQVGESTFDSLSIQSFRFDGATAYLCVDASQADLLDASGVSVVNRDQPRRVPLQVDFVASADKDSRLIIGRSELWSGQNFCQD